MEFILYPFYGINPILSSDVAKDILCIFGSVLSLCMIHENGKDAAQGVYYRSRQGGDIFLFGPEGRHHADGCDRFHDECDR